MPTEPKDILDHWIGPNDLAAADFKPYQDLWYKYDPEVDTALREKFGDTLLAAERGELDSWLASPEGAVALIILFDQFSRNLYRGTADVYRNDARALDIARQVINNQWLDALSLPGQLMVFHPLMHAEDVDAQQQCVNLFEQLHETCNPAWQELVASHLKFVRGHADIVEQFGRFPHRNAQLGRESTDAEKTHLEADGRSYGQGES